jgi:class 3 adenylate cyclase
VEYVERFTRNLAEPDESLTFEKGSAATVRVGDLVVGRLVQEPGWRWSEHVRPVAGTASCEFRHIGVGISGSTMVLMDDGTRFEVRAGDVFDIPPGHDVWVVGDEPAVSIIWGGWRGWGKPPVGDRVLLTMVMTDIVESTSRLSSIGDTAWDRLLEQHNATIRHVFERYRATEIDTTGDGFLATLDGAARAVQAAIDIRLAVQALGLHIRTGIHTGEVELVPGSIRGLAVHETARIMSLAGPDEIFTSSMTADLAAGAGYTFEDRGMHQLKGVPTARRIYALNRLTRVLDQP